MKSYHAIKYTLVTLAIVCALVGTSAPAQAQSLNEDCTSRINIVQSDLDWIYNYGNLGGIGGGNPPKTYSGLSSKFQGAKDKLEQKKYADAKQKLQDFKDAVILMRDAAKPKRTPRAAELLLDGGRHGGLIPDIDEGVRRYRVCVSLALRELLRAGA